MIIFIGKVLGRLFLVFCKIQALSFFFLSTNQQIEHLQREIQRLKAANATMRQQIKRQNIKPSFTAKCRFIFFALKFKIPCRKIRHYLPLAPSTLYYYISKAKENIFDLIPKASRPRRSPDKTQPEIATLIKTIKNSNPAWGYLRIAIHLWNLHIFISPSTVRRILLKPDRHAGKNKKAPIEIKPFRSIKASRPNSLWSLDLTTFRLFGIFPLHVLGVIDHFSRKVFCLSSTFHPTADWINSECERLFGKYGKPRRVITDNGSQFTAKAFRELMKKEGVRHIRTSVRHPQSNGKIERFFQSLKYEFMSFFFLRNRKQVDRLLKEYLNYYNQYRLHEAIDGQAPDARYYNKVIPKPPKDAKRIRAPIEEVHFGNGLLKAYQLKQAA